MRIPVSCPSRRYNRPEPTPRPTRSARTPPTPPRSALAASCSFGPERHVLRSPGRSRVASTGRNPGSIRLAPARPWRARRPVRDQHSRARRAPRQRKPRGVSPGKPQPRDSETMEHGPGLAARLPVCRTGTAVTPGNRAPLAPQHRTPRPARATHSAQTASSQD
jgi:hypothetical protein